MTNRARRSLLYTPGHDPEKMEKTADTNADGVVFDLETGVPVPEKATARANLERVLAAVDFGEKERCVRINSVETDWWLSDVRAAVDAGVDTIRIPRVQRFGDVRAVVETTRELTSRDVEFLVMLETPRGVSSGADIARQCRTLPEVTGLSLGATDYAVSVATPELPTEARSVFRTMLVLWAALGNMDPIAGVYKDLEDADSLREFAERAAALGFVGQSAISPSQIEVINAAFTPSDEQLAYSRRIVDQYDDADGDSVVVDGRFLDADAVARHRRRVDRYRHLD